MTLTLKDNVQKHVVTSGDHAFAAAGQPLFTCTTVGNKNRISYNLVPGQMVAYTVNDGVTLTVDDATLAASDLESLFVGVGIDTTGNGLVDDIRHIGIEDISGCIPREATASSPRCGAPQVKDFYFDCTKCDETYSVMVSVDDNRTRSYSPWNKSFAEFVGSIVTNCSSCSDCPVEHNCREVACKLADALNNELDLRVAGRLYPDWRGDGMPRPYYATRLHANSFVFCFSPTEAAADACEDCTHVAEIKGYSINGGDIVDFTGNVDPSNPTYTFKAQMKNIADQLNEAFETEYGVGSHAGSAYVTGSYPNCCDIQLHVNTCDAAFSLYTTADVEIVPCQEYNPFTEYGTPALDTNCIDCAEDPGQPAAYPCGIRVIAEQISGDCGCFVDKPLSFYGRTISIDPFGEGWRGKPWMVVDVQAMELPAGFGSWIQWLELQDEIGGRGRTHSRINVNKGWQNLPDSKSRVRKAVTADCDKDYCSYYLKSFMEKNKISNEKGMLTINSYVHIPSADSTTVTAWEAFFDALLALNPTCRVIDSVNCDTGFGNLEIV